ncbi:pyridoxal-phosphate dependent enzyme, partial [Pseudomonas aeruginosa]
RAAHGGRPLALVRQVVEIHQAAVISATRGNHGQSVAFSASRYCIQAIIVVPHVNSRVKNGAMRSLGAELIEHGEDFQASREYAAGRAR